MAGTLFVVATPIGNLEDISARALRVLGDVALIAAEDTRHTGHLLQRFGLATRTTSFHEHSEKGKAADLVERLKAGDSIALVSDAGTPTISDPGTHLVRLARDAGIRIEPVPGPSAVMAALSVSGFETREFAFLGFPPSKGSERHEWFDKLEVLSRTVQVVAIYEAPHRVETTLAAIRQRFGNVRLMVGRELTKLHEEVQVGPIDELRLSDARGEFTILVEFCQTPERAGGIGPPPAAAVVAEFGEITKNRAMTRRQAISLLSRKYGLHARELYAMVEASKKSPV
jgi:16S rRNA (cytidine1402-2'-O)-methyltransferase